MQYDEALAAARDLGIPNCERLSQRQLLRALEKENPLTPQPNPRQTRSQKKVARLIDKLSNRNSGVRLRAEEALVELGGEAVPQLVERLKANCDWETAALLGKIADQTAMAALVGMLDGSEKQRNIAAIGLGVARKESAVDPLRRALKKGNSSQLISALISIGSPRAIEIVAKYMVACSEPLHSYRSSSVSELDIIRDLRSVKSLQQLWGTGLRQAGGAFRVSRSREPLKWR